MTMRARAVVVALAVFGVRAIRDSFTDEMHEGAHEQDKSRAALLALDNSRAWADWPPDDSEAAAPNAPGTREQRGKATQRRDHVKPTATSGGGHLTVETPRSRSNSQQHHERPRRRTSGSRSGSESDEEQEDMKPTAMHLTVEETMLRPRRGSGLPGGSPKSGILSGSDQEPGDDVRPKTLVPPLNVHHVTFNSGNGEDFKEDDGWKEFFAKSTKGVDEKVDIVIFGFQEIHDSEFGFQKMARQKLWEVHWKGQAEEKLEALARDFALKEDGIDEMFNQVPDDVTRAKDAAVRYLHTAGDAFKITTFVEKLKPEELKKWAKRLGELLTTRMEGNMRFVDIGYPNLDADFFRHRLFSRAFTLVSELNAMVGRMEELGKAPRTRIDVKAAPRGDKPAILRRKDSVIHILEASSDFLEGGARGQPLRTLSDSELTQAFSDALDERLRPQLGLGGPTALDVGGKVRAYRQTWNSGTATHNLCHTGRHYDTNVYVFVNLWSNWLIETEPFTSSECTANDGNTQKDSESRGCNINNSRELKISKVQKPECGKVVQILRLKATRLTLGGVTDVITICVMNTHMSRKGGSKKRLEYLTEAMKQATQEAGCDAFSFGGDFNSRLDCERPEDVEEQDLLSRPEVEAIEEKSRKEKYRKPVSEFRGSSLGRGWRQTNSLETVLDLFRINQTGITASDGSLIPKKPERYALTGNYKKADELTQYLEEVKVRCWESKDAEQEGEAEPQASQSLLESDRSGSKWWLHKHNNTIADMKVKEGKLNFNPTYKLKKVEPRIDSTEFEKSPFIHCAEGMHKCYYNKDGDGKNNPAWPDRVLAWSGDDRPDPEVTTYDSVNLVEHKSDHNPVVAQISFWPSDSQESHLVVPDLVVPETGLTRPLSVN